MSRERVQAMTERVNAALNGPTGMIHRLQPEDLRLLKATRFVVQDEPSPRDLSLIGNVKPGERLLGLYTQGQPDQPEPTVTLFAASIEAAGYEPEWVLWHEWGHRAEYNHYHDEPSTQAVALLDQPPARRGLPVATPARPQTAAAAGDGQPCPACELDTQLAVVSSGLDALQQRAHVRHRIPDGLGGRIPEFRTRLAAASDWLAQLCVETPGTGDLCSRAEQLIQATLTQLAGSQVTPEQVSRAYRTAYAAYDAAFDLGHEYWLRKRGH